MNDFTPQDIAIRRRMFSAVHERELLTKLHDEALAEIERLQGLIDKAVEIASEVTTPDPHRRRLILDLFGNGIQK